MAQHDRVRGHGQFDENASRFPVDVDVDRWFCLGDAGFGEESARTHLRRGCDVGLVRQRYLQLPGGGERGGIGNGLDRCLLPNDRGGVGGDGRATDDERCRQREDQRDGP